MPAADLALIFLYVILAIVGIVIQYLIIKTAVKNGILAADAIKHKYMQQEE